MPMSRPRRPLPRRIAAAVATAGVLALALSGCVGAPAPTPTPSASGSAEPIFASDEEALAAAVEAYEAYIAVSEQIGEDGGSDPDRILALVTPDYADEVIADFENMSAQRLKVVGSNTLDTTSIVERNERDGVAQIAIYGCVGVGTTRILDENGADITPPDRDDKVPLVLNFESQSTGSHLVLAGSELWTGNDFC